jgi:hypothetical protein
LTIIRSSNGGIFRTGGGVLSPTFSLAATLHQFTLQDTSGAGSSGLFRVGLAFEKGDVPSGDILTAEIDGGSAIRVAMLNINTWSDGSLRSCTLIGDAGTFTSSQAKTINVSSASGTQSTSSIAAETYIDSIDDFTLEITNHVGSSSGALGDLTFSLQTAMDTASRVEITDDTDLCVRFKVWEKVSGEEHVICIHYVDLWLDPTDASSVIAVEWTPVLSMHWWVNDPFGVTQTKEARTYDAEALDGVTSLVSHTGLEHGTYCRAAMLRDDDDAQHAKRLWATKGAAMPTLLLAYSTASKQKMAQAGYLPPLTTSHSPTSPSYTTTYTPFGESSGALVHNHRRAINGTGGYEGRGAITNPDSLALILQTESTWRAARVSAMAGLSVYSHVRDHRTASGGFADGDASGGLIPASMQQLGAQSYTSLAGEIITTTNSGGSMPQDAPTGGVGEFTNWDEAHHVSYAYFMAFVEGEAYLADTCISAAEMPYRRSFYNEAGSNARPVFYTIEARRTAQGISSTSYGAVHALFVQERSIGLCVNAINRAYQIMPDGDRHKPYFENIYQNISDWLEESLSYFPADHLAKGGFYTRLGTVGSPWMNCFAVLSFWDAVPYADIRRAAPESSWARKTSKPPTRSAAVVPDG